MEFDHIHFKTVHLSALRAFYTDTFECPVTNVTPEEFTVNFGATAVTFTETDDGSDPFYHFAINVPQNQFDDAATWLADRVELLTESETGDRMFVGELFNSQQVYCHDPAGNIVELIARHDLSNDSDSPFSSESFREVSEIGLPVPDNKHAAQAIGNHVTVSLYNGDDVSAVTDDDQFTAIGNDRGTFIVVRQGRPWFPTRSQAAEVFPIAVGISEATSEYTFPGLPYRIFPS